MGIWVLYVRVCGFDHGDNGVIHVKSKWIDCCLNFTMGPEFLTLFRSLFDY